MSKSLRASSYLLPHGKFIEDICWKCRFQLQRRAFRVTQPISVRKRSAGKSDGNFRKQGIRFIDTDRIPFTEVQPDGAVRYYPKALQIRKNAGRSAAVRIRQHAGRSADKTDDLKPVEEPAIQSSPLENGSFNTSSEVSDKLLCLRPSALPDGPVRYSFIERESKCQRQAFQIRTHPAVTQPIFVNERRSTDKTDGLKSLEEPAIQSSSFKNESFNTSYKVSDKLLYPKPSALADGTPRWSLVEKPGFVTPPGTYDKELAEVRRQMGERSVELEEESILRAQLDCAIQLSKQGFAQSRHSSTPPVGPLHSAPSSHRSPSANPSSRYTSRTSARQHSTKAVGEIEDTV